MAISGGGRSERAKRSEYGEDRLGALYDDLLVHILVRLDTTAEAVRTSVLARRWREVWRGLPVVRLDPAPDGSSIRDLLEALEQPDLRLISVTTAGAADPDSAAAWLPAASRRVTGALVYDVAEDSNDDGEVEADDGRGHIQLPCFEKASDILLSLGFLVVCLPSAGRFGQLAELTFWSVRFHPQCDFGTMVSSPRCPSLKILKVQDSRGLQGLSIRSKSLLRIDLSWLCRLRHLMILSSTLQWLSVMSCFHDRLGDNGHSEWSAKILAPQLLSLLWADAYDPQSMDFGNMRFVRQLKTQYFFLHGQQFHIEWNQHCRRLLQRFKVLDYLNLQLIQAPKGNHNQYLFEDITVLPRIMFLRLDVVNSGHSFGASLFHLLNICTDIRRLLLELETEISYEAQSTCPSGCICDQPVSWKTEELSLSHLESVAIGGLLGSQHEVSFVKQLFKWGTVLKKVTMKFDKHISEKKAREFYEAVAGSSRPETCMELYMYNHGSKNWRCLH